MIRSLAVLLPAFSLSFADVATQTDWSGGPGVPGPVSGWGSDFSSDTGIDWMSVPGTISLCSGLQKSLGSRGCWQICPADLDGDGDLDIAGSCNWTDAVCWWENEPLGDYWIENVVQDGFSGPEGLTCADFDGDGDIDIAAASMNSNDISWWENEGSGQSWTKHLIDDPQSRIRSLDFGDIDGDGDMDLVGCITWANQVAWWENDGSGQSWTRHVVASWFDEAWDAECEDIDDDGSIDIVACAATGERLVWWDNDGGSGTNWVMHVIAHWVYEPKGVTTGDIDGDGDMDVLATSFMDSDVAWWSNNGGSGTSWTRHVIDSAFVFAHGVSAGDFDNDGDIDVIGTSLYPNAVAWWRNLDGQGTSWEKNWLTFDLRGASCTACADTDGDGTLELFAAGWYSSMIWDADANQASNELVSSIIYVNDPDWLGISWTVDIPIGTSVTFQVRASDDYTQMGEWSDTLTVPCSLDGILEDYDSFVQYRAILSRSEPGVTPVLHDVTFTWNPLGVEGGEAPEAVELRIGSNPSAGSPSIEFGLPSAAEVSLAVFDMAGRVVASTEPGEYAAGCHTEGLGELAPGVYFIRLTAGEFEASERFVVIE